MVSIHDFEDLIIRKTELNVSDFELNNMWNWILENFTMKAIPIEPPVGVPSESLSCEQVAQELKEEFLKCFNGYKTVYIGKPIDVLNKQFAEKQLIDNFFSNIVSGYLTKLIASKP